MNAMKAILALTLAAAISLPVLAAGYIKFDGVDGESVDKDHKGWIELLSVSQHPAARDAATGMATGKRQHKPITLTKPVDKATPILRKALTEGRALTNVHIEVDGHVTVLKQAHVVSIEADAAGNEVVTLAPVAGNAGISRPSAGPAPGEAKKKGNVEYSWKVEEGEK